MAEQRWYMIYDVETGRPISSCSEEPSQVELNTKNYTYVEIPQQPTVEWPWDEATRKLKFVPAPAPAPSATIDELKTKPVREWTQEDRDTVAQHNLNLNDDPLRRRKP